MDLSKDSLQEISSLKREIEHLEKIIQDLVNLNKENGINIDFLETKQDSFRNFQKRDLREKENIFVGKLEDQEKLTTIQVHKLED